MKSALKEEEIRPRGPFDTYLELVRKDCERFFGTPDSFARVPCPACDSADARPEFEKEGFQYGQCGACGTLFAITRPRFESLQRFYTDSPSTDYWIKEFFSPVAEVRREKMFKPRAEYVSERFGADPQWVVGDIGAGFGLFSSELKLLWPESRHVAIEPSADMAAICDGAGLEVLCESLERLSEQDEHAETFDLLTAFELFEHLHTPHTFAAAAFGLLKPGGSLMLTTLNGQGFDIQVLWDRSKSVYPPCHLNFFNPDSVRQLLTRCGFELEEIETPGQLDWNILEGMILNEDFDAGRLWNGLARHGRPEAKADLQDWLQKNRMSSHMRVIARKPTLPSD